MRQFKKVKTMRDKKYRKIWIPKQPCCNCGNEPIENERDICLAHTGGGTSLKGADNKGIPLCKFCHDIEHEGHKTFKLLLYDNTGMTWEQHASETYARYKKETTK